MTTLYINIAMVIVFLTYIIIIEGLFGSKLDSISKSFYLLGHSNSGGWFRGFCLSLVLFMMYNGGVYDSGWFFFSGAGAAFVGAATHYMKDLTGKVHFAGAGALILFAAIGLAFMGQFISLIVLAASLIILLLVRKWKRRVYIYEIIAFIVIIGELFIVYFKQN